MRLLALILIFISIKLFSQSSDCIPAAEITVTKDEIQLSSDKYQIKKDIRRNYILFYPEGEKFSFWYKITVDSDCRFAFKVTSADSIKTSKYFLYKNPDPGNFCNDIKKKKIIPARSGSFTEEKGQSAIIYSSGKKKEEVNFIHPVTAIKGEVYYLNIQHKEETQCGHYLNLIVSSESVSFHATYPECIEKEKSMAKAETKTIAPTLVQENNDSVTPATVSEIPKPEIAGKKITEIAISTPSNHTIKKKITDVTVTGVVLDSISKKPLMADLKWSEEFTGKEIIAKTNPMGEYSIVLEEKVIYKLTCSVIGYREKTTKFIRQNLNSENLVQNFEMTDLKPGENFVLRHIYFYAGNYAMKPESQAELDKLYSFLLSHEKVKIEIQGHTNGEGKIMKQKTKNRKKEPGWDFHGNEKKLSKYRAEAIKEYLLKKGIAPERIIAEGMGASKMIYPEPRNQKEREANRRVEVYILSSAADLASVLNAISD